MKNQQKKLSAMPGRKSHRRCRTSSQSSVEMQVQVTKEDTVITTTTNISTSTPSQNSLQVKPKADFLELLRNVGAKGTQTAHGEIFTLKELGQYLYQYIKKRALWDPWQPTVVHCDDDPLGKVFGVKMFTRAEADTLLLKNTSPVNFRKRRYPEVSSSDVDKAVANAPSQTPTTETDDISSTCLGDSNTRNPPKKTHMSPHGQPSSSKIVDEMTVTVYGRKSPSFREGHSSSRKSPIDPKCFDRGKSPSPSSDASRTTKRSRQSSLSIVYEGSDTETSYPWFFQVQFPVSDSEDEVYSVQGKVTDTVCDSNDDWSGDEELSIEIQSVHSSDPHYFGELEVDSDSGSSIDITPDDVSSSEEILVVCRESDMDGFWADSESSDSESCVSTDPELSEMDKWICTSCENRNTPKRSRCDKCWEVRPGWVTGTRRYPYRGRYRRQQRSRSVPNSPRPTSSSEMASYSDHEFKAPSSSVTFPVKSLSDLAQFACNMRKITPKNVLQTAESQPGPQEQTSEVKNYAPVRIEIRTNKEEPDTSHSPANKSTLSSGSEKGTDILNSSDEEGLYLRMQEFEDGNKLKSRQYDSGISESFYSSQGSLAEGFSSGLTQNTNTSATSSQVDTFDSGLDSSCGLSKSDSVFRKKMSSSEPKTSGTILDHILNPASNLRFTNPKTIKGGKEEQASTLSQSKSVVIPHKSSTVPIITKSLTLPASSATSTNLCVICLEQPKDASLVHGNCGHQVCCYQCGRTLKRNGRPCPVCRRPIQKVIRNFPG